MAAKNKYLQQMSETVDRTFNAGHRVGQQQIIDYLAIALNEEGYGYERIMRVLTRVSALNEEFFDALNEKRCAEADVLQERLDALLREICKGRDFMPFAERYPEIKHYVCGKLVKK